MFSRSNRSTRRSTSANLNEAPLCKICLESEDCSDMIHPCKCHGSISYVHESCLKTWILGHTEEIEEARCELCHHQFEMTFEIGHVCHISFTNRKSQFYILVKLIFALLLLGAMLFVTKEFSSTSDKAPVFYFCATLITTMMILIAVLIVYLLKKDCVVKKLKKWKILEYHGPSTDACPSPLRLQIDDLCVPRTIVVRGMEVMAPSVNKRTKKALDDYCLTESENIYIKHHRFKSQNIDDNYFAGQFKDLTNR